MRKSELCTVYEQKVSPLEVFPKLHITYEEEIFSPQISLKFYAKWAAPSRYQTLL
jgi:hypothetical protein